MVPLGRTSLQPGAPPDDTSAARRDPRQNQLHSCPPGRTSLRKLEHSGQILKNFPFKISFYLVTSFEPYSKSLSVAIVAPTPSSAIIKRPISTNFRIKDFLEIGNLFQYGENQEEAVMLRKFPFSLCEEAKIWLNELNEGTITSWNELREAFIRRYFSPAKFKCLLNNIHSFHQLSNETLVEAWILKEMLRICYGHGLTKGTIIQLFYHGLDDPTQGILDTVDKFEALATKIDSEFLIIRKELKEMQDGRRDNHVLDDYLKDDTLMCEPHEANYVQRYHRGYHDHEPINSYSYPNHNSHPSRYFEFTKTSMEEMMREWMASQKKVNERMKNQMVELENQINQGLRNHQAIIQNLERQFEFLLPTETLPLPHIYENET
ncbi:reverse transcriptase domain-containing protein [Tanacetum coccineum]